MAAPPLPYVVVFARDRAHSKFIHVYAPRSVTVVVIDTTLIAVQTLSGFGQFLSFLRVGVWCGPYYGD